MIVFFSGTGNSRWCAQFLARRLGESCVDSFPYLRSGDPAQLHSDTPWVFVAPTYSWQLPRVFSDFLRRSHFSGCREAYFVMTCGAEVGASEARNRSLCAALGLSYRGTLPVVMPDNYLVLFPAPTPEEIRSCLSAAPRVLEEAAGHIRAGEPFPPVRTGPLDGLKSGLVNALFSRFQLRDKAFTVSSACISCGRCRDLCPLGNIRLEGGKPVWGGHCTHCMACLSACPVTAIEYGKATRGKARYQCPPYEP